MLNRPVDVLNWARSEVTCVCCRVTCVVVVGSCVCCRVTCVVVVGSHELL